MRVNEQTKSMDIEQRDINYILPAYIRLYLFQTKNVDPEKIIFPMFREVPHPVKMGVMIPIEFVPDSSPIAIEIMQDGNNIPEATKESEAAADKKEIDYDAMKVKIAELEAEVAKSRKVTAEDLEQEEADAALEVDTDDKEIPDSLMDEGIQITPEISKAKAAFGKSAIAGIDADHQPTPSRVATAKTPPGPALPPGTMSDYGGSRDVRDSKRINRDLKPEREINEDEEREDDTIVKRVKGSKKEK